MVWKIIENLLNQSASSTASRAETSTVRFSSNINTHRAYPPKSIEVAHEHRFALYIYVIVRGVYYRGGGFDKVQILNSKINMFVQFVAY